MLIILFGLAGSGKSFIGNMLATDYQYYFWDADTALPSDMKQSIINQKPFTQEQRDRFTKIIIYQIKQLLQKNKNLIVAQALYKEKNRSEIYQAYPDAKFIQVESKDTILNKRITLRDNEVKSGYAKSISQYFEPSLIQHHKIINNENVEVVHQQIKAILQQLSSSPITKIPSK